MSTQNERGLSRRAMLAGTATAGAVLAGRFSGHAVAASPAAKVKTYKSADFYDRQGELLVEKAREAYYDMFRRFAYPISDRLQEEMWILDFGLGDFARVGMAGIFWLNRQDYAYFGHEIYLLPGQMLAEHCHLATDKGPAKMESWQPRRGTICVYGEGEPTPELLTKVPESQRKLIKSQHGKVLQVDETADLNRLTAWHFMIAGPEGALVTEYGTFHDMDGLRLSNPEATL